VECVFISAGNKSLDTTILEFKIIAHSYSFQLFLSNNAIKVICKMLVCQNINYLIFHTGFGFKIYYFLCNFQIIQLNSNHFSFSWISYVRILNQNWKPEVRIFHPDSHYYSLQAKIIQFNLSVIWTVTTQRTVGCVRLVYTNQPTAFPTRA
jgi:hypothetical protein